MCLLHWKVKAVGFSLMSNGFKKLSTNHKTLWSVDLARGLRQHMEDQMLHSACNPRSDTIFEIWICNLILWHCWVHLHWMAVKMISTNGIHVLKGRDNSRTDISFHNIKKTVKWIVPVNIWVWLLSKQVLFKDVDVNHKVENPHLFFTRQLCTVTLDYSCFLQPTLYSHIGLQLEYYYSKFEASISVDIIQQMPQKKKAPHS